MNVGIILKDQVNNLLLLFLILFLPIVSWTQGWEKNYKLDNYTGTTNQKSNLVSSTIDGGAIIITPGLDTIDKVKLTKVDQDGTLQFYHYLPTGFNSTLANWITKTTDGGYILMASNKNSDYSAQKLDKNGKLVWNKSFYHSNMTPESMRVSPTSDGGCIIYFPVSNAFPYKSEAVKLDINGNYDWGLYFGNSDIRKLNSLIVNADQTYTFVTGDSQEMAFINKVDSIGNPIFSNSINDPNGNNWIFLDAESANNGEYSLLTKKYDNVIQDYLLFLVKIDALGNYISEVELNPYSNYSIDYGHIKRTLEGGYIVYANVEDQTNTAYVIVTKTDETGTIEWVKTIPNHFDFMEVSNDSSYYFINEKPYAFNGDHETRVVKLDKNGTLYGNFFKGNVFSDTNLDCAYNQNELGYENMLLQAKGDRTFWGLTDSVGNYMIEVDTGTYNLEITNSLAWNSCNTNTTFVMAPKDTVLVDFPMQPLFDCPYLTLDISTPFLRRCFDNTYTISYCNLGTTTSLNTEVELVFHPHFDVVSSTIPWTNQSGNSYIFPIGNLNVNDCGNFKVVVNPICDSTIIDQTLCINGNISPDSICTTPDPGWDGSITDLSLDCGTDSLTFTIKNIGFGDMGTTQDYFVIQDNLITKQGSFQLLSMSSIQLQFPANGSTYRLYAGQAPGYFPPGYNPTIAYEGCGTNTNGLFSTGFITMFPESNLNTETTTCQEIIGSFDPNDKQATPKGYGNEHFINVGDDLNYRIRFQNTGTDTAFTVVIRDTISEHLNIGSLITGASSHPYELDIINGTVLKFSFKDILLVDSFTNEPASHGFVKFKISQQPNLPLGTMVYNSAAIFFDYNEPIITNETYHEIGENFIPVVITSSTSPEYPTVSARVQPNPFNHYAEFILEGAPQGNMTFELYDAHGRLVRRELFSDDAYHRFYKENLTAGIYFYKILLDHKLLVSGKIIAGN